MWPGNRNMIQGILPKLPQQSTVPVILKERKKCPASRKPKKQMKNRCIIKKLSKPQYIKKQKSQQARTVKYIVEAPERIQFHPNYVTVYNH